MELQRLPDLFGLVQCQGFREHEGLELFLAQYCQPYFLNQQYLPRNESNIEVFPPLLYKIVQFFVLVPIKIDFELVQKLVNQIRKVCQEIEKVCVKRLIVVSVVTVSCQLNVE